MVNLVLKIAIFCVSFASNLILMALQMNIHMFTVVCATVLDREICVFAGSNHSTSLLWQ